MCYVIHDAIIARTCIKNQTLKVINNMQHKILNITRLHYKILGYTSQYYQIHIERFQTRITSYLTYTTMNVHRRKYNTQNMITQITSRLPNMQHKNLNNNEHLWYWTYTIHHMILNIHHMMLNMQSYTPWYWTYTSWYVNIHDTEYTLHDIEHTPHDIEHDIQHSLQYIKHTLQYI